MIDKQYGSHIVICDICGEILNRDNEEFHSWEEAKSAAKASGWVTKKRNHTWVDICPECREEE